MTISKARLLASGLVLLLAAMVSWPGCAAAGEGVGSIVGTVTIRGNLEPGIIDAVVWVEGVPHDLVPKERWKVNQGAQMAQKDTAFVPHVLPVIVGTTVAFPNDDPIFHNVFSASPVH